MAFECRVLADSISPQGHRITTILATFPRFILAEVNTHRMLSKSSASSRAIPVAKRIAAIADDPFVPLAFGKNKAGMQAAEGLEERETLLARAAWDKGRRAELEVAAALNDLGVHKQHANRRLEADAWHTAVITGTEWANFFALRRHPAAQPEFQVFANMAWDCIQASTPCPTSEKGWHLPFVENVDWEQLVADYRAGRLDPERISFSCDDAIAWVSAGRCARVSYLTHEGKRDPQADFDLGTKKLAPVGHMAPLEHAARVMTAEEYTMHRHPVRVFDKEKGVFSWDVSHHAHFLGNVQGWVQLRKMIPNEHDFSLLTKEQ